ncbi:MAG: carboxypeptidase-like regulatory domain-containing protein, partial [Prolixibacteraceae bacterium]|nr:carboxypeptidase-like regulatory domain-containing protein [Prolixibacteraceae bacterium]
AHEKVHIRENHWFDLLFIELLTVIFWFNPFIWFFERSIKQNHEYLADEGVLAQGHPIGRYQALLINQLMGMQIIGITNNLNFALNKNRFKMMTKTKTSRFGGVKFAWALPIVALLLFAFAEPDYQLKDEGERIAENMNPSPLLQKSDEEFVIHGKVVDAETGEPMPGASIVIKGTPIGTVADKDGKFDLTDPNPDVDEQTGTLSSEVIVSFVGKKTIRARVGASGKAIENGTSTFKLEDKVELISTESPPLPLPPPPPPPAPVGSGNGEVFYIVEDVPEFPGGKNAFIRWVNNNVKFYDMKGNTRIGFTINGKGEVTDIKIVEKDNDKLGQAGAEIISKMPPWKPATQRGKPVPVKYLIDIKFE